MKDNEVFIAASALRKEGDGSSAEDLLSAYWRITQILCDTEFYIAIQPAEDRTCKLCGHSPVVWNDYRIDCDNKECLDTRDALCISHHIDHIYPKNGSKTVAYMAAKAAISEATAAIPDALRYSKFSLKTIPKPIRFQVAKEVAKLARLMATAAETSGATRELRIAIKEANHVA